MLHLPTSTKNRGYLCAAHAAQNLQTTDPDVFISSDGGYSWRKVYAHFFYSSQNF